MAVQYLCSKCRRANVISDTRARWDLGRQEWRVVGHYDSGECLDCGDDEATVIEVELAPANP